MLGSQAVLHPPTHPNPPTPVLPTLQLGVRLWERRLIRWGWCVHLAAPLLHPFRSLWAPWQAGSSSSAAPSQVIVGTMACRQQFLCCAK